MTEKREDDYLVIVRAQVMTRDESTEGWIPFAGGGLANVSVRRRQRLLPSCGASGAQQHEYIIYGQRISDQNVILSCAINRELEYNKVMPTFHHWRAGKQRNGLTFTTAADARAFDKGVVGAYNELIADMNADQSNGDPSSLYKYGGPHAADADEDEVFMALDLPLDKSGSDSQSGSQNSAGCGVAAATRSPPTQLRSSAIHQPHHQQHNLYQQQQQNAAKRQQPGVHIISFDKLAPPPATAYPATIADDAADGLQQHCSEPLPADSYAYVQLASLHEYRMPAGDTASAAAVVTAAPAKAGDPSSTIDRHHRHSASLERLRRETVEALSSNTSATDIDVAKLKPLQRKQRCRYCQELYTDDWNGRGACRYAPDNCRTCIEQCSCFPVARGYVYHCMSDAEGDTVQNPCTCTAVGETNTSKRWIGLVLLALVCPCLCLFPPLRACHLIGVRCGLCGGRHKPQV